MSEQMARIAEIVEHRFDHSIVDQWQQSRAVRRGKRLAIDGGDAKRDAAFDADDRVEPAIARNVGRLR